MAEPKDNVGFFRRVARIIANPATDWADLNSRQLDDGGLEQERSEIKAMVERKRRNDFVRKREFDMLRKIRREGLTPEQLAALGGSSKLEDSESRPSDVNGARADVGVKAKIDEIEQQMVAEGFKPTGPRRSALGDLPTQAAPVGSYAPTAPMSLDAAENERLPALPPLTDTDRPAPSPAAAMAAGLSPLSPLSLAADTGGFGQPFAVEVSEVVVHDPELDEAVIAFANADFEQCEQALAGLAAMPDGPRVQHAETWLVLFDLYRATGQQHKFENLALDYAHQFGWSAPQWFSMPRLVAEAAAAAAAEARPAARAEAPGEVGWVCPAVLDIDAVARLRSQTLQMPLPWVFDWSALQQVDAEAATHLSALFRHWANDALEMRWQRGEHFLDVLAEAAPTGVRDADPAFWIARLEALRLANRPDQFDEVAIDYCVTYEVSPPSWERARCQVRIAGSGHSTQSPALSQVSEVSTTFVESALHDDAAGGVAVASVELSGQLVGDIGETLRRLDGQLGAAGIVNVNCARLIRVDFIAAGDLLNWVLAKRGENRAVSFVDAHRLIALFFGAMGITEHAKVRVRTV